MSAPFRRYDPNQGLLLPPNLWEWLPEGHLAYFVMDVVAELDLKEIYAHYDVKPRVDAEGQVIGQRAKSNAGRPAYEPQMMTALLLYAYATGTPSSRQIEKKCIEDVAYRVISADQKPDHATIAEFRRVHLEALGNLFVQVLQMCREAGLVKMGHVALDGTKVKANASKHKAMSYERMVQKEPELRRQVEELMRQAQEMDQQEDRRYGKGKRGDEVPQELKRRQDRLAKIREAKAALEAQAREQAQRTRQQREQERKRREDEGDPPDPGRPPAEPSEVPKPKAQRNFTDPESRIMKNADQAFIQGYNAQAAVDHANQVIVACDVTNQASDAPQLRPMVQEVLRTMGESPRQISADAGYFSEENLQQLRGSGIEMLVAAERIKHGETPPATRGRPPEGMTWKQRMMRRLRTLAGRAAYALRKVTVEPVFGQMRTQGLARFWLRGIGKVKQEWRMWCTGHNLQKLFRSGRFVLDTS